MTKAKEIADALGAAKKTQAGYICRCPCHDDKKGDSLSVKETLDGKILFHCFANCDWRDITAYCVARKLMPSKEILSTVRKKSSSSENKKTASPMEILRTHEYVDADGKYLFEKVKTKEPNKQGNNQFLRTRQTNGDYIWNASHVKVKPLYNLPNVIRGVRDTQTIYVTEGEKDADTLIKLGFVATTSCTSSSWLPEYSAVLKMANVIIIPDNDAPGIGFAKKRLNSIRKEAALCKMLLLPETFNDKPIKDVTDYFEAGAKIEDFNKLVDDTEKLNSKSKNKDEPSRKDYSKLIHEFFGTCKRDIFSDDLCYFDKHAKLWIPCANKLKPLRSEIREKALTSDKELRPSEVEDHLYYLENAAEPQFMIDIPKWDGEDRIKILANRVKLSEERTFDGINSECFEDLLKYWHAKMWQRLYNPEIRNEVFILAGPQNIGKDFWIRENCGALGQYLVNFSIHTNERDTKEQLHRGLVMNISEFDRTSRAEVSLLKEVITATQTDLRFAYDRRAMTRLCRCSFIASTNVRDIFNDPTGHSRYIFFELKNIDRSRRFTENDKLQVLAQGKFLAMSNFEPESISLAAMYDQIVENTPDDQYELLIDRWDYLCSEYFKSLSQIDKEAFQKKNNYAKFSGFLPNNLTFSIVLQIAKEFSLSPKKIRSTLKLNSRSRIDPDLGKGYYFKFIIPDNPDQNFPM